MTNVPAPTFGPKGFIAPQESQILQGVTADINGAMGGGLNPALSSPQGQLASSMTALIGNANDTFAKMANDVDPSYADGRYQDGIARIYFIERLPSQPTVVVAQCSGLNGVVINVGALAQSADGNIYTCTVAGTIDNTGSCSATFSCNTSGAIACPAGALNTIYQSILGWDSITNIDDGIIGRDVENRSDFETRRYASVAGNAMGFLPSVQGAIMKVTNVLDAYVTENFTNAPITVNGVTIAAHSLYACVVGGNSNDVAKAIWTKKSPGCGMTGNTTVTVYDDLSGYDPPLPSYQITYEIPDLLRTFFSVTITNNAQVPADATTQIQNAIINAFAGLDGGPRPRIGSTIYASRFYAPVAALGPWVQIVDVYVGSQNTPSASIVGSISGTTLSVASLSSGLLAANQFLTGSGVVSGSGVQSGTLIVSQLSGSTGGTGTYLLNISQIVVGGTAMNAVVPTANTVVAQINQAPTVDLLDIVVNSV